MADHIVVLAEKEMNEIMEGVETRLGIKAKVKGKPKKLKFEAKEIIMALMDELFIHGIVIQKHVESEKEVEDKEKELKNP
jgi:hypothetical protein